MRTERGLAEADPLADDDREHECGHAGVDVDHGAAGEVDRCDLRDQTALTVVHGSEDLGGQSVLGAGEQPAAPHHVCQREVDHRHPDAENAIHVPNLTRSASAPLMSAVVMIANVTWNAISMTFG